MFIQRMIFESRAIPSKCFELVQMFMMNWLIFIDNKHVSRDSDRFVLCICTYNMFVFVDGKVLRNTHVYIYI